VADRNGPPIVDMRRQGCQGSTISPYRSSRVEKIVFPWQVS
jgi:hypothetical protein